MYKKLLFFTILIIYSSSFKLYVSANDALFDDFRGDIDSDAPLFDNPKGDIDLGEVADPSHKIEYAAAKDKSYGEYDYKITYGDGSSAVYNGWHKPLILNGSLIKADVKTLNDRTLVPLRIISENLGSKVGWDDKTRKVTITRGSITIELIIGNVNAKVSGKTYKLDVAPTIFNDYTYVPLRFISESFGAAVSYNTKEMGSNEGDGYMIVSKVKGNVIIDLLDKPPTETTKSVALKVSKEKLLSMFGSFKIDFNYEHPNETNQLNSMYETIQKDLDGMKIIGEVSRYYLIDGPKYLLYDKYSGNIFFESGGLANSVQPMLEDSYNIFIKGYYAD
jgi:hypothetical protein